MDFDERVKNLSGWDDITLQELGLVDCDWRDLTMVAVSKFFTNMSHNPQTVPRGLGLAFGLLMGRMSPKDYLAGNRKRKKVKLATRDLHLSTLTCPKHYRKSDGKKRVIILSHGFQSVSTLMLHYYKIFMEEGFDCIWFDHRGHGEAKDYICTMGYHEAADLTEVCRVVREDYGKDAIIGVLGESFGSGTGAFAMKDMCQYLDFAVLDCGYSGMGEMAAWIEKLFFFLPKEKLYNVVDAMSEADGARYSDVKGLDSIAATPADFPIYFAHGGIDFFVATHFSKDMYAAKKGAKEIDIYPLAFHAMSQALYNQKYTENVRAFLKKYNVD